MNGSIPTRELYAFAKRLRQSRVDAGLSQRQLAKLVVIESFGRKQEISPPYISRLEKAQRFPSTDMVYGLADALGLDRHWLLTGQNRRAH